MLSLLKGPFWLLYILEVGRSGGEAGRYQVPEPLNIEEVGQFLETFRDFFEEDGRHELWIAPSVTDAKIVYDNHNVLYLYGPLDTFIAALGRHLTAAADRVEFPYPHCHHHWPKHDVTEARLLAAYEWVLPRVHSSEPRISKSGQRVYESYLSS